MEYSQIIVAAAFLFGVFFIGTGDSAGLFQAFKTFQNANKAVFSDTFSKFSNFFLVILFFEMLFALLSFFTVGILLGFKKPMKEIEEGNIPTAILAAASIIGFAIVMQFCAKEVIMLITPQYISFR